MMSLVPSRPSGTLSRIAAERTDLSVEDRDALARLVEGWAIVADLALSDLVLWVPTWNEAGLVAVAQVRPSTAPTAVPQDAIGTFAPRGRHRVLDQAMAYGRPILVRDAAPGGLPTGVEAYPLSREGRVIGVIARHPAEAPRVAGRLEEIYLASADDLLAMVVDGRFPYEMSDDDAGRAPRVGDGLVRLDAAGVVEYASPNAVTAMRRLGLAKELVGVSFAQVAVRLSHRPGPVDASLSAVASGRSAGGAEIENQAAVVLVQGYPLSRAGERVGALVFCRDVTDLRRRERALLSKDATIREIHHRVKNNLQTVAAMLRLQARRASTQEAQEALAEAELRVAAIAIVHESLSAESGEYVDFDGIVDRVIALIRDLAPAYAGEGRSTPRLSRQGSWGSLSSDLATPLAMAVSELLHNAVEHAGADAVWVDLATEGEGALVLTVGDDGRGLPEGFALDEAGLGLSIVTSLVTGDLHGTCEVGVSGQAGTLVRIMVPTSA